MRAAVFKEVGQPLAIETVPDPTPGPGQVVLKVGRCGICGTDLHSTDGHGATSPSGSILGHEYAGEVVALGAGVERLKLGDRVSAIPALGCGKCVGCLTGNPTWCPELQISYGGYAEYSICGQLECVKLPSTLSLADGALVEPLAVAIHGVRRLGITPNSRILVLGAGPIGLAAIFWARRLGASRIEVVEGSPKRAEIALQMGADSCKPPSREGLTIDDMALGGPIPPGAPDIVIESAGVPGVLGQAIKYVRPRGKILVLGFCTTSDTIVPAVANSKEVSLDFSVAWSHDDFEASANALDAGALEPRTMITDVVTLDGLPPAFEALRNAPMQCKVMVDPWSS